jgi:predicted small lipoprotein YifL
MNRLLSSLIAIALFVVSACGSTGPSGSPGSTAPTAPSTPSSSAASTAPSGVAAAGQTDTEWGRIWDTLPNSFPEIPGARPTEEAATGPASATFVIAGDVARLVAAALVTQLAGAGFPTAGLGSPLEDGSYTLDATGSTPGCKVQLTIKPMGGETFVTILYGAACPHD